MYWWVQVCQWHANRLTGWQKKSSLQVLKKWRNISFLLCTSFFDYFFLVTAAAVGLCSLCLLNVSLFSEWLLRLFLGVSLVLFPALVFFGVPLAPTYLRLFSNSVVYPCLVCLLTDLSSYVWPVFYQEPNTTSPTASVTKSSTGRTMRGPGQTQHQRRKS